VLVPEDPVGVAQAWEVTARALESIGAEVELPRPGLAYFDAGPLRSLYRDAPSMIGAVRDALKRPSRIGGGPTRFVALAAALEARSRRARLIDERDARRYLAAQPVSILIYREQTASLVPHLERLGISTLDDVAALGAGHIADRFGKAGTLARNLAMGKDTPLLTRKVEDRLEESMKIGESISAARSPPS
jgi:protein ImuB